MNMIKRGTVKGGIVGVVKESDKPKDSKDICCVKCGKCFKSRSEAESCAEKNCPLK